MSQYLNASFAQILTYDAGGKKFLPPRAAGTCAGEGEPVYIANSLLNVESLALGKPVFIKDVRTHEKLLNNAWIELEGIASFAAHPLVIEERLVGAMVLFTKMPLAESIVNELASVANGVALCVDKHLSKQALDQSEEERVSIEAQYRHAQKLESVGQLAAGIAHDFNNILTVIQGHVDLMLHRTDIGAVSHQLKQVSAATQRAASLTRQLLMFSHKQVLQFKVVDLNTILRNLEKMLPRLLGEDVAIEMKLLDGIPFMDADVGMIEQVVMNMVVNARDAMPGGGKLTVTTGQVHLKKADISPSSGNEPGSYLRLCVSDTGSGMSKETLARIFEPFFTTKQIGKGTGLGLATAYGIVKQHHGRIDVESEVGKGTTFKIYIPVSTKKTLNHETEVFSGQIGHGRGETILVVEDEDDLRAMVSESLLTCGYNVLEAANGVDALKIWDAQAKPVDLMLTDIVMPMGVSGIDLAKQIRARKPDAKVIFTSGYSAEISGHDMTGPDKIFLPKPYTLQKLTGIVRECLDKDGVAAETVNGVK